MKSAYQMKNARRKALRFTLYGSSDGEIQLWDLCSRRASQLYTHDTSANLIPLDVMSEHLLDI